MLKNPPYPSQPNQHSLNEQMMEIAEVSLIVPVFNEIHILPVFLAALENQLVHPREIIFVDVGSVDASVDFIRSWWHEKGWNGGDCKVILRPAMFPGQTRNEGIKAASNDWIAFLDISTIPDPGWLAALMRHAGEHHSRGIFGVCRFLGKGSLGKAICALSYGQGTYYQTLPASLFRRDIFYQVGFFPGHLRAAEDKLWRKKYAEIYPVQEICRDAMVFYTAFPRSILEAVRKWTLFGIWDVRAGFIDKKFILGYISFLIGSVVAWIYDWRVVAILWAFYLFGRGILDPMRRSRSGFWWNGNAAAFVAAMPLAVLLDFAKAFGYFQGLVCRERE